MSLKLPTPGPKYDATVQARANQALEAEDLRSRKNGADVELNKERLIIRSPNGTRYQITVSNAGALSAVVAVP